MIAANRSSLPEPSLLDISRFETPSLHFTQSQTIVTTAILDSSINLEDMVDERSLDLLQLYLHGWQQNGLFSTLQPWVDDEIHQQTAIIPLHILRFAQDIQYRFAQIRQYLQFIRIIHLLKIERKRAPNARPRTGERVDSLASKLLLKELYDDWDTTSEKVQADRRLRFRKNNRDARKWLLAASRLSFGVLMLCGKPLEKQITKNGTESQVLSSAAQTAERFPSVVETYRLLDDAIKDLLNNDTAQSLVDPKEIIIRIEEYFHTRSEACSPQSHSTELVSHAGADRPSTFSHEFATTAMEEIIQSRQSPRSF